MNKHAAWIPAAWVAIAKKEKWRAAKWEQRMIGHVQFGIARWEVDLQLAGVDGVYHGASYDTVRDACDGLERLIDEVAECMSLMSE